MRDYKEISLWKDVSIKNWSSWHWQLKNSITNVEDLKQIVNLSQDELKGIKKATKYLRMKISPHIAMLMDPCDSQDTLRRQFIPSEKEIYSQSDKRLHADVNADESYSPVKGLVHRYPSKVLIFPSNHCGAYCRYCFRRKLARDVELKLNKKELDDIIKYLERNSRIEEVILSGGDPLVLEDAEIEYILSSLSKINHIQIVRFHTRMPVTIPYRITNEFINILQKFKQNFALYIVIHIDTSSEFSPQMNNSISKLVDNGFPCFASCPLLEGINDDPVVLRTLWTDLIKMRVKPYYLFQSDPVQGLKHFLVPLKKGIEIMKHLYDRMSGLAMPLYCFNVPNGGGHVLINYSYITEVSEGHYSIINFEGKEVDFFEN